MKITLQELKQLIKESVQEMMEARHDAGMFSVTAVLDEPKVVEAINLLKTLSKGNESLKKEIIDRLTSMN